MKKKNSDFISTLMRIRTLSKIQTSGKRLSFGFIFATMVLFSTAFQNCSKATFTANSAMNLSNSQQNGNSSGSDPNGGGSPAGSSGQDNSTSGTSGGGSTAGGAEGSGGAGGGSGDGTSPATITRVDQTTSGSGVVVAQGTLGTTTLAFNNEDQQTTLAFNDNYPSAGDSDYNDFVTNMKVNEVYDIVGNLSEIRIEYTPKYKISGTDHQLILVFDGHVRGRSGRTSNLSTFISAEMFSGNADIQYELYQGSILIAKDPNHSKAADLVLFPSTATAVSKAQKAIVTISNIIPEGNEISVRKGLSVTRYRTVLNNGGYDIDLGDINPTLFDSKHAPNGFFVPVNWRPPKESQSIYPAYPLFTNHAQYLYSGGVVDNEPDSSRLWFNTIGDASLLLP